MSMKAPQVVDQRRPDDDSTYTIYNLVDQHGGGELIPWMRFAIKTGDETIIEEYIETKVKQFLYSAGKGKLVPISELVSLRNKERNAMLGALRRKKGKGKSGPNILEDFNQDENQGDLKKALKLLDGGGKGSKGGAKYREIVWETTSRGRMGEHLVGVCLLQSTTLHCHLARKLMHTYPKMINDIFLSEDYYAIINEDAQMVGFLLQRGADIHQRCYGAFFCPDDQKASRNDSLEHEWVDLRPKTNYTGRMYFGEYPLSFAACMNQIDCYRMLRAKRADPNLKDTNGNTVLHLTVIHDKPEMLKFAYETGAKLQLVNNQNLTPLTLAAKLAKKTMFEQILKLESDVVWVYGDASSIAYPLAKIDTIDEKTGNLNQDSALALVAYGESEEHLDLLDGLLEDVLQAKWEAFGKRRWMISFGTFIVYYIFFFIAFICRPVGMTTRVLGNSVSIRPDNITTLNEEISYLYNTERCHLWSYYYGYESKQFDLTGTFRLISEVIVILSVTVMIIQEAIDVRRSGRKRWWRILSSFPAKLAFKITFILNLAIVPMRLLCWVDEGFLTAENVFVLFSVLLTTVHFLYYLRAIKFVGPFIQMVYLIIAKDLSIFSLIFAIFLVGFSQAFYVIFMACQRASNDLTDGQTSNFNNCMGDPIEAMLRLFIMTVGEFTNFYQNLSACDTLAMEVLGKFMFFLFEMLMTVMLLNLLIAMMTRTYEVIFATRNEYKRQWAQVILMLEISLKPRDRLIAMLKYSRPIGTDKKRRAFVVTRKKEIDSTDPSEQEAAEEEEDRIREEKRQRLLKRHHHVCLLKTQLDKLFSMNPVAIPMNTFTIRIRIPRPHQIYNIIANPGHKIVHRQPPNYIYRKSIDA